MDKRSMAGITKYTISYKEPVKIEQLVASYFYALFFYLRSWISVTAGYEYTNCPLIIWSTKRYPVNGFDLWSDDFYGYSLDVHHR